MGSALQNRFKDWLGCWRGARVTDDSPPTLFQIEIVPHFDGEVLQVDALVVNIETGETLARGIGFWTLDAEGRVINTAFRSDFGHCVLRESPDDEEVLAMEGGLPGNQKFVVTMRHAGDEIELNSRVFSGYQSADGPERVSATLKRVTVVRP